MTIIPYGDSALLINFEQVIDPQVNENVIELAKVIEHSNIAGVTFLVPAYCSLAIGFQPERITFQQLKKLTENLNSNISKHQHPESKKISIPICYESEFALDKQEVMSYTNLSWDEIKQLHLSISYRVYMLGFLPGFVYMGSLPEKLESPRKKIPRLKVPALSVGLAGFQTGIYPLDAPGGWQIIGKTPIRIFDNRNRNPFLFEPGMLVTFKEITEDEFYYMATEVDNRNFDLSSLYG
ncbi:MAG TPA: 5-oxoprolinase subunit PxpB [Cyclobacteriaceae bacterium]|jgi:inhibitor of KinA